MFLPTRFLLIWFFFPLILLPLIIIIYIPLIIYLTFFSFYFTFFLPFLEPCTVSRMDEQVTENGSTRLGFHSTRNNVFILLFPSIRHVFFWLIDLLLVQSWQVSTWIQLVPSKLHETTWLGTSLLPDLWFFTPYDWYDWLIHLFLTHSTHWHLSHIHLHFTLTLISRNLPYVNHNHIKWWTSLSLLSSSHSFSLSSSHSFSLIVNITPLHTRSSEHTPTPLVLF